ncbi:hypothetical protein KC19_12G068300 [Ceratodon purpureus]|uniref:C2H2-type domain-containing protein n=1 Tax=Ceratodon purpureus TaxID=3225 RepID=A0A8T0G5H9_CERPU|nr:hypothetical protein KC19_12G068200 [Ceratodon purpureus]KAG0554162.1 hypothetical protein KC19_12G068300 [Ceratodon purpureus]
MICESRGLGPAFHTGSMYYNVADSGSFPLLTLLESAGQVSPSYPPTHGMAQDFQQFGSAMSGNLVPQMDSSTYSMKPRGLWCFGLQSDVAKEWSYLLNKSGMPAAGSKVAAETSVEGGVVIVRSQLCPWSSSNVNHTNRCSATDPIRFQRLLDDAFPSDARRLDGHEGWCKYCATLEKELMTSLEVKDRSWADESSWEDVSFKQVDQYFEPRTMPLASMQDSRKRKYEPVDGWENDRALVLLRLNELNTRATRAEQRVLELEQVLREHALGALDDTCDDSDIVTCTSQHNCFNEDQAEMLVCKIAGCNKSFKSSKTLRRHVLQKHSDNARLLVCNQPTVNGEMCRFETIHSGVLSYHRKHSLAHQRREDWHIACPFCQSKFARQHEMERHRRICKSRPAAARVPSPSNVSSVQSSVTGMSVSDQGLNQPLQMSNFVVPDRGHNQHLF